MIVFPYPIVVADIGGTNARFALVLRPGATRSPVVTVATGGFPDFVSAFKEAARIGGWPAARSLLIGGAGPVKGRQMVLTNADWTIDGPEIAATLGLEQGILLNDFETLAVTLPSLGAADLMPIGEGRMAEEGGTRLVVGPGTGLGVGALAEVEGRFLPLASEGGHIGFPAETEYEQLIWSQLGYSYNPPEAETLLAGPGLPAFHQAVGRARTIWPSDMRAEDIIAAGIAKTDPLAEETLWRLLDCIARFCSDMALTFVATGGVYLAGGILPRLRPALNVDDFRTMFERNESLSDLLATIPINLITAEDPALTGLAALAAEPDHYMLNYRARLWK